MATTDDSRFGMVLKVLEPLRESGNTRIDVRVIENKGERSIDIRQGYSVDGGVGLGLAGPGVASEVRDQPAMNERRSVRVVLDGRIHNAQHVRDGLGTGSHSAAGAPKVYVGVFKDDAVGVIDTAQNKVLNIIAVPKGPHGLVMTADGRKVYVSSDGASTVSVIDTATDRVVASVDVGANPHGLAISADGSRVLVSGWGSNRALVIDTATDRVIGEAPVAQPHNGTLSRDGRTAWVGSQQQGATALVRFDLTTWKEVARVPLDKTPRGLELSPDGRHVFFTLAGVNAIQVLDTATNRVVTQIPVGPSPHYAPFTPDGRWALAVVQGPGELSILDASGNALAGSVAVGKAPHWSVSTSDSRTAYVTNEGSNDVSVVDLASRTVTATIPVGNAPRKIAVQPISGAAGKAQHVRDGLLRAGQRLHRRHADDRARRPPFRARAPPRNPRPHRCRFRPAPRCGAGNGRGKDAKGSRLARAPSRTYIRRIHIS